MNTINEDYCSFEVSKLLKEKGLREPNNIRYGYNKDGKLTEPIVCWEVVEPFYPRVTHQFAMKWLEIKKHIAIIPILSSILDNEKFLWDVKIVIAETGEKYSQGWVYENREQACEAAIKYTLENLI